MFEYKPYCGIGSRLTPDNIVGIMMYLGLKLAQEGYILRSGAAPGADTAFEIGAKTALVIHEDVTRPEIYLPWPEFEGRDGPSVYRTEPQDEAFAIAAEYHPNWKNLSQGAKLLQARNVHQVLGFDVTRPQLSNFIICWTPDGKGKGGTGQALRIARGYGVTEVYDLFNKGDLNTVKKFLT